MKLISAFIHNQNPMFPSILCTEKGNGKGSMWHLEFRESVTNNVSFTIQFRTHDALTEFLRLLAASYSLAVEDVEAERKANDMCCVEYAVTDDEANPPC